MERLQGWRARRSYILGGVAALLVVGFLIFRLSGSDGAVAVDYESPEQFASALFADPDVFEDVSVDSLPDDQAVTIRASSDDSEVVFSTGEAGLGGESADQGRGDVYDVTTLKVDVNVSEEATCMVIPRLRFGSDDNAETADGFVIEVDESTWSHDGGSGPDTLPTLTSGVVVDTGGGLLPEELSVNDITVAQATPELEASIAVEPGQRELFFSIYDAENATGTSVATISGIRFEEAASCRNRVGLVDPTNLVALGDSYTSGFGLPPFEPGTEEVEGNNCQRSTLSYPEVLAEMGGYELESLACQGASTIDLYEEFSERDQDPQLEGLGPDTGVVVITIGGNDTGWADALTSCVLESLFGSACNENAEVNEQFTDILERLANESETPAEVTPYEEVLRSIRDRAPFAEIVIVSYPPLFAEGGIGASDTDRCEGFLIADQVWMNEQVFDATATMTEAAESVSAVVVDVSEEFDGHGLCEQEPWFMELSEPGPLHPTEDGHAAIAEAVQQTLERLADS